MKRDFLQTHTFLKKAQNFVNAALCIIRFASISFSELASIFKQKGLWGIFEMLIKVKR